MEGFHVPVIAGELFELVGSAGGVEPKQICAGTERKESVMLGLTVIGIDTDTPHCPLLGVKI